jgi:signal transduction histidine kinase
MIGWRIRLRPLMVLLVVVPLGAALALGSVAGSRLLRSALGTEVPASRVSAVVAQFGQNSLLLGIIVLAVGATAAFAIGTLLVHPLARLRVGVAGLTRGERDAATVRSPISEYHALAAAVDRAATESAQHLTALSAERDAMATLVNVVSEGILQVGADGRVIQANPAACRLLGIPEDAVGQPLRALIRQAEVRGLLDRAMEGHIAGATEVALDERRLLVSARPIAAGPAPETGDGNATVITFTDLTEVRRLEGVRRDFVANVSHELKTPLTSIRGYVETLMMDELPEDMKRQFLEVIQKNAERLQGIVDDLLDLSRLESGVWRPEMQVVDALRFAEETWSTTSGTRAARKRIEFLPIGEPGAILADPRGLRQVLTNLYDNALRHTPEGGRITVRVGRDPALNGNINGHPPDAPWVSIDVQDTGSGIPSDALPRIFERFYRVDPARSRAEGGTGLGLSIVKHLMESMGGSVTAESELGKGTTIRLRLVAP